MGLLAVILNIAGLLAVLCILAFDREIRMSKRLDIRYFRYLCFAVVVASVCMILKTPVILHAYAGAAESRINMLLGCFEKILFVLIGLSWLVFADASAFKSPDRIKRRYALSMLPVLFMAALSVMVLIFYDTIPVASLVVAMCMSFLALVLCVRYIYYAWKMAHTFTREAAQPLPLKLEIFIVPWLLCFVNDIIPVPPMDAFFEALAVGLTWYVLKRRNHYLDNETGFYRESFIPILEKYLKKNGQRQGSAVLFKTDGDILPLMGSINEVSPESSSIFRTEEDEIILYSPVCDRRAADFFIKTVCEGAGDTEVEARSLLKNEGEALETLFMRIRNR